MNQITKYLLGIIIVSLTISCKKDNNLSDTDNILGLPPVTQIGANTFGCLVNGKPWVPSGNNGTANLSIDYDPGINKGIFGISSYSATSSSSISHIGIGVKDSLNFIVTPREYELGVSSLYGIFYSDNNCFISYFDLNIIKTGRLKILYLNKTSRIIAGVFSAKIIKPGCDTINITNGRFDMKF